MGQCRGSRKHVLDWVEQPGFLHELEELIVPAPCRIAAGATYMPRGHLDPAEARLDRRARLDFPPDQVRDELRNWWLRHPMGANTPNWDLAVTCEVAGRPGLVLVEAKAHVRELTKAGKAPLRDVGKRSEDGLRRSHENAAQIDRAIESARHGLANQLPGIDIRRDRCYQLSNRLAFGWKLASCGIPTVLLYLGFTGDTGMREPLRSDAEWRSLFRSHLAAVCPSGIPEAPIRVGATELWVLCRARVVLEPSPKTVK